MRSGKTFRKLGKDFRNKTIFTSYIYIKFIYPIRFQQLFILLQNLIEK